MKIIINKLFKINPRWSETKKKTIYIIISTLMLFLLASMFFNALQIKDNVMKENIIVSNKSIVIAEELLKLNNHLGPSICEFIAQCIVDISKEYDVDPFLVFAIIKWESWGKPRAKNPRTQAMGLMGVLYTKEELKTMKDWELCDIKANIGKGTQILREWLDSPKSYKGKNHYPEITRALLGYNGVSVNFNDGFEYVSKVLGEHRELEKKLNNSKKE